MAAFGNFSHPDQGSSDGTSGRQPADIGLDGRGHSALVLQALDLSPASFNKPPIGELPSSFYGAGQRARLQQDILTNDQPGHSPLASLPLESQARGPVAGTGQPLKKLSALWPATSINGSGNGRSTDIATAEKPVPVQAAAPNDLIAALSAVKPSGQIYSSSSSDTAAMVPLPPRPISALAPKDVSYPAPAMPRAKAEAAVFNIATAAAPTAAPESLIIPAAIAPSAALSTAKAETGPYPLSARAETGPLPVAARAEVAQAAPHPQTFDAKTSPFFANLKPEAIRPASSDNFNARMQSTASLEDLARQIMPRDTGKATNGLTADQQTRAKDPFKAEDCTLSLQISPEGKVTTITTLANGSASQIETSNPDKSSTLALADGFGRILSMRCIDANGQVVSQTSCEYNHATSPLVPSRKTVETATQTIAMTMNDAGTVISSKIMPNSKLNDAAA